MKLPVTLLLFIAAMTAPMSAVEHVTVLGDSLTKEYQLTFPGLPGLISGIDPTHPAARNWSEILNEQRHEHFDQGVYKGTLFNRWSDLRLLGHEYNWAVPGATARALRNLVTNQNLEEITSDADMTTLLLFAPAWRETPARLASQLSSTSAAVIWCGGNDLRFGNSDPSCTINGIPITYQTIYDGDGTGAGNPQPLMNSLRQSIQAIALQVQSAQPGLPIVVCAVPHVGGTPKVRESAPTDPVRTARITTALKTLNAELCAWTQQSLGGTWVDVESLTASLIEADSLVIGGVPFLNRADDLPASAPATAHHRYLFAHDGFHPGTALHAVIAQLVQSALRTQDPVPFAASPVLTDRDIIVNVLGLAATTGFDDFMTASGAPAGQRGPGDDPDGDAVANIIEFALDGNTPFPGGPVTLPVQWTDGSGTMVGMTWKPRYQNNVACSLTCQQSADLITWTTVPAPLISVAPDGTHSASVPATTSTFLRLKIQTTP